MDWVLGFKTKPVVGQMGMRKINPFDMIHFIYTSKQNGFMFLNAKYFLSRLVHIFKWVGSS